MMRRDTTCAAPGAALRAATPLIALVLLVGVGGCAPQVASVVPLAAMAASQTMEATGSATASGAPTGERHEAQRERCNQVLKAPPGVEEVKLAAGNTIWSREIRIEESGAHPQWVVYVDKHSNAEKGGGWRPQPSIARLQFAPALDGILSEDDPRFLAYAPMVPERPWESEQMMSIAEDFGSQVGTFKWRGRIYSYTLVKKLPCFPGPE
jgi:hypothetical protein